MAALQLLIHAPGAPGLRWFGLGPGLRPTRGLWKLQRLFNKHAFWAQGRTKAQLRRLLAGSSVVVSLWQGKRLVGFGRASSDGIYRSVLWDVVVAGDLHGLGLGRRVVEALLAAPALRGVERIYLMTTNSAGFYEQLGFRVAAPQALLVKPGAGEAPGFRETSGLSDAPG
ncbi:MAG: GNAT family N-acetyltransferase [Cyanobacteria bacterium M_surface_7_m2_040]|nr:GNAT family N-acetyltransferase [Cyanobacteria bacterium M_surface_7_m2_040]